MDGIADEDEIGLKEASDEILGPIIEAIAQGEANPSEWACPWHGIDRLPTNPFRGNRYRKSNLITLWSASRLCSYRSPYYATAKSWIEKGCAPDWKHGVSIWRPVYNPDKRERWTKESLKTRPLPVGPLGHEPQGGIHTPIIGFKRQKVYNADVVFGADKILKPPQEPTPAERHDLAERIMAAYAENNGPLYMIGNTNQAYYTPSTDRIHIPDPEAFHASRLADASDRYYSTSLHETIHSTLVPQRLDRKTRGKEGYAKEELVAELGAALLGGMIGISTYLREDHVNYLGYWLNALRNNIGTLFWACSEAEKATDYILKKAGIENETKLGSGRALRSCNGS